MRVFIAWLIGGGIAQLALIPLGMDNLEFCIGTILGATAQHYHEQI